MTQAPAWWKTELSHFDSLYAHPDGMGAEILCHSPGGRPVYLFSFGERRDEGCTANYSSACGAHDRACYDGGAGPCVVLIGAEHGQETEGVAALSNLIALLATGRDLLGRENEALIEAARGVRACVVPVANPDGRARVTPSAIVGMTGAQLRFWGQGTWKDGKLCGWPDCKKIHPIKGKTGFLGGYFNDDGVNLMHDDFFNPMARETAALLALCARERPNYALHLHGGSNSQNHLLQPAYVPIEVNRAVKALAEDCDREGAPLGLRFEISNVPDKESGATPPSFNLVSAAHHACGAVSACFESNECLIDEPGPRLTHQQILDSHLILFERCFLAAKAARPDRAS